MQSRVPIAIGAGLVSGLLFLAAATGAVASLMVLVLLTPLPIAIAGFSWGWMLGAIAAVTAGGFLTLIGSIKAGLFHLLLFGLPTIGAIYYLLLNREYISPDGRTEIEWYPVGWVLFWLALASGVVATVALLALGSTVQDLEAHVAKVVEQMMKADIPWPGGPDKKPTPEQMEQLTKWLAVSFPGAVALSWMWIVVFNLWIGAKVARASGLLIRPWPNISLIALPRWAGLALAAGIALSFLGAYPGLIASGFTSGILIAFVLVGLAIVHNVTWRTAFRPMILFALYLFLFFFNPFSGLAVATLALLEPYVAMRRPENGGLSRAPPDER